MTEVYHDPERRQDYLLLFDVTDGNPNGDPDSGNLPRVDPETMQGLVTDVAIKRKVRNYVDQKVDGEAGNEIYVKERGVLNRQHQRAYDALDLESTGTKQAREDVEQARDWMCQNFYDIRTFGAVMSTDVNCGQVRGPMQLTFARSVDPVVPMDMTITRVAVTKEEDAQVVAAEDEDGEASGKVSEMGRKALIPYGLFRAKGFFNPSLAEDTGFGEEDLKIFWEALRRMWDLDRSSSRGMTACRGLYVFSHDSQLGRAPSHELFGLIEVERKEDVEAPRSVNDYEIHTPSEDDLPEGVEFNNLLKTG